MKRRLLTILVPLAASLVAAGCSTFDATPIASVDGEQLERSRLDELLSILPNAQQSGDSDPSNGADVRQAIDIWVRGELQDVAMRRRGVSISDEQASEVTSTLEAQVTGWADLTDGTKSFLVDFVAGEQALADDPAPPSEEFLARYDRGPEASGLICVSHILVEDRAAADDVESALADGADFATLAADVSTDPGSGAEGGSLGCYDVDTFRATFVTPFVEGALAGEIGVPTPPVESDFGWHVILVDDAASSADDLGRFETDPRYLAETTDVSVDPRYGTFDPVTGSVVGLGAASAPLS